MCEYANQITIRPDKKSYLILLGRSCGPLFVFTTMLVVFVKKLDVNLYQLFPFFVIFFPLGIALFLLSLSKRLSYVLRILCTNKGFEVFENRLIFKKRKLLTFDTDFKFLETVIGGFLPRIETSCKYQFGEYLSDSQLKNLLHWLAQKKFQRSQVGGHYCSK
jgi:hypothetical protein